MFYTTKILALFLLALVSVHVVAQMRTANAARQIATSRLATLNHGEMVEAKEVLISSSAKEKIKFLQSYETAEEPFRIFRGEKLNSYVIVSGDERMKPILGESQSGIFNPDSIPCGLVSLLAHYSDQYSALQASAIDSSYNESGNQCFFAEVSPLISSRWGQESPYNDCCPPGCPSGCVATAMAQIMRFYEYPVTGSGSFSYTSESNKYKLSYNFGTAFFDWPSMKNKYSSSGYIGASEQTVGKDKEGEAVADLMKACGVSVGMDYAPNGSGALDADIPYAIINFFDYNSTAVCYHRAYFNSELWYEKLHEELDAGRPVLYCGQDTRKSGGHAFIIDGYRQSDGKFHVNWGWDGTCDGYYELDALNPSTYRFASSQSMIARFCPDEVGEREDIFCAESFKANSEVKANKNIVCTLKGVYNLSSSSSNAVSSSSFNGVIGIGLYNGDLDFIRSLAEEEIRDLHAYYGFSELPFSFTAPAEAASESEVWYLMPYAKALGSESPTPIRTLGGTTDYIAVGKTIPDNGSDIPVIPDDDDVLFREGFDDFEISNGWTQVQELGRGDWKCRLVIKGDNNTNTPPSFSGKGYAYLPYDSGTSFADTRTVTRLISTSLNGNADAGYMLTFQCRKYSSKPGTSEILAVYIDRGCTNSWELLTEQAVTNGSQWLPIEVPYIADGPYRLCLEGSIEYGANLFLDELCVYRDDTLPVLRLKEDKENASETYSFEGKRVYAPIQGLYIKKYPDGTAETVYYK